MADGQEMLMHPAGYPADWDIAVSPKTDLERRTDKCPNVGSLTMSADETRQYNLPTLSIYAHVSGRTFLETHMRCLYAK